jgi:hypothetical protein
MTALRNIGIIVLLAVAVFALPGGGTGAGVVEALISIAFFVGIWLIIMRLYRENRMTIFSLGDRYRGILYGALCGLLFAGAAAREWFDSAALTFLWFALVVACGYGLYATYRHWREYA